MSTSTERALLRDAANLICQLGRYSIVERINAHLALSERAAEQPAERPRLVVQCARHKGQTIFFRYVPQTEPMATYCPNCEDDAASTTNPPTA